MKKENISCKVIQDLLPLYEDGCCSDDSRKIVENHLAECENCRKKSQLFAEKMPETNDERETAEEKAIKRGANKIKRMRNAGIIALILAILIVCVAIPVQNYRNGQGLPFENTKELNIAKAFVNALCDKDYETAYSYFAIEEKYSALISEQTDSVSADGFKQIVENGFVWYDKISQEKFIANMTGAEGMDEMVVSFSGYTIQKQQEAWDIEFEAKTTSGQDIVINLLVSEAGIKNFSSQIDCVMDYDMFGNPIMDSELEQKNLKLSRFYRMPTLNEPVMELLYEGTGYDWEKLFEY